MVYKIIENFDSDIYKSNIQNQGHFYLRLLIEQEIMGSDDQNYGFKPYKLKL